MTPEKIGFPPPLLGEAPCRLSVLHWAADTGLLILEKPAGILVDPHPWYSKTPSLVAGLAAQVEAGKPELAPFGFKRVHGVGILDAEIEGAALIAANRQAAAHWRDAHGSGRIEWVFELVARAFEPLEKALGKKGGVIESADRFECRLPIVGDAEAARARVSHRHGKQARTRFERLEALPGTSGWSLWRASTTYHRPHQLRLHALESGLELAGEALYQPPSKEGPSRPAMDFPLARLSEIRLPLADGTPALTVAVAPSKEWRRRVHLLVPRSHRGSRSPSE